jgi:hypothetical protein
MEEDRNSSVRSSAPVIVGIVGSLILPCLSSLLIANEFGYIPGWLFLLCVRYPL